MPQFQDAVSRSAAETEEATPATPATSVPELMENAADELPGIHERRKPAPSSGLRDKVVVITGAGAGIGRATAMRFAEEGARIAAWDVSAQAGPQLESAIQWAGGEGCFQSVNVTHATEVEAATQAVIERWKRIDVLINN